MQYPRATTTVLLLASTLAVMAGATLSADLPHILAAFPDVAGAALRVRLVLTIPALSLALSAPLAGILADRVGARRVLVASIMLYAAAGVSGLVSGSVTALLVGRVVVGIALGGVVTGATTLIADLFQGRERGRYMGLQASAMAASGLVFVVVGGFLSEVHWRAPFALFLLALPLAPVAARVLPGDEDARAAAGAARGATAGQAGQAGQAGRRPAPIAPLILVLVTAVTTQVLFMLLPVQLPFVLEDRLAASGGAIGAVLGLMTLADAGTALLYSRLRARFEPPVVMAGALVGIAVALALVASARSGAGLTAAAVLFGAAFGPIRPNLHVWAAEITPPGRRGRVMGGVETGIFLGQFLSPVLAMPLLAQMGYPGLFAGAAAVAVVAAGGVLLASGGAATDAVQGGVDA